MKNSLGRCRITAKDTANRALAFTRGTAF